MRMEGEEKPGAAPPGPQIRGLTAALSGKYAPRRCSELSHAGESGLREWKIQEEKTWKEATTKDVVEEIVKEETKDGFEM